VSTIQLTVQYRPLRVGFLVREGCLDDLVEAARLTTALWGGLYNPLIPVASNHASVDRLIRFFGVDLLHPVADDDSLSAAFSRYDWLPWRAGKHRSELLMGEGGDRRLTLLDVSPVTQHYWEHSFRHKESESPCVLVTWSATDPLRHLFALMFGQYTEVGAQYAAAYERRMKAQLVAASQSELPADLASRVTPLGLSGDRLHPVHWNPGNLDGAYVGTPTGFEDLVSFWNLRASGARLVYLPVGDEERVSAYVSSFLTELWKGIQEHRGFQRDIGVWSRRPPGDSDSVTKAIQPFLPDGASVTYCPVSDDTWNGHNAPAPVFHFEPQSVLGNVDQLGDGRPYITVALPQKPWPLSPNRNGFCFQKWGVVVSPLTEREYEHHTLYIPHVPELNRWYSRECAFFPSVLRVQRGAPVFMHDIGMDTLSFSPIERSRLIARLLEYAGLAAELSMPGRITERVIRQMGGLEDCRVFKITGVRKLIASNEAQKGVTKGRATEIIFDEGQSGVASFARHKGLHIESRAKRDLDSQDVLDFLLKKRVFRTGLMPKCPHCELTFWLPVDSLSERCTCELCGHEFPLAPQLRGRGDWRFRLTGLFGREDNQEGALPVILTLFQFLRIRRSSGTFVYSTALNLKHATVQCESDLIVLELGRDGEPNLLIGECKTNKEIDGEDVGKLLAVREAVVSSGMGCYLVFSKATEHFMPDEVARFRELHKKGITPILFTERELEPYQAYLEDDDADLLPNRYPSELRELAENSAYRYLREERDVTEAPQ